MMFCTNCDGTGIVCENHANRPWAGDSLREDACGCGAGMPCPRCTRPVPQDGTHSILECFVSHPLPSDAVH